MSFSTKDVKKIAHLACLALPENEIEPIKCDLDNIIALIEKMNQQDTNDIEPLSHAFNATQPLRPDIINETNQRELMQSIAPEVTAGLYIVPQFIETE